MDRRIIAPGFVADALDRLSGQGIDPAPLLAAAGLPAQVDQPVSNVQFARLWWLIAQAMEDEFMGLAARPMRPGGFAMLCHAILHTGTLERALRRALRFLTLVLDDPRGELRVQDGRAEILLTDAAGPRAAFAYRTYWLVLMGGACWLVGRRIPLRGLDFRCAAPADRQDYHQFFGAPVRFDQPVTRLVFDAAHLALPVIRSEAALRGFLREAPANILLRYRQDHGVSARVRDRLAATTPADWPGFEVMAADLHLSPATLRRQLRLDGQTYAALKDDLRLVQARRLLSGPRSVAQIAADLGYSEPSAFHRAFVKWTGQSPGAYRLAQIAASRPASSAT